VIALTAVNFSHFTHTPRMAARDLAGACLGGWSCGRLLEYVLQRIGAARCRVLTHAHFCINASRLALIGTPPWVA